MSLLEPVSAEQDHFLLTNILMIQYFKQFFTITTFCWNGMMALI